MQSANQVPFIMLSAERKESVHKLNVERTAKLRKSLEKYGFNHKACLGHFDGEYENSFAVFLDNATGMTEHDMIRTIMYQADLYDQDSVLFVGPSDGIHGRRAYLIKNDEMVQVVNDWKHTEGTYIGHWKAIPMGDRHAYGDFTLDLLDSERAYVVQ